MPTAMRGFKANLEQAELAPPFPFSKQMPLLEGGRPAALGAQPFRMRRTRPATCCSTYRPIRARQRALQDAAVEQRLCAAMARPLRRLRRAARAIRAHGVAGTAGSPDGNCGALG